MEEGLVALEHQALDTLVAFHLLATITSCVNVSEVTAAVQARTHLASAMIVSCSRGYLNSGVNSSRAAIVGCACEVSDILASVRSSRAYMELGDVRRMRDAPGAGAVGGVPPPLQAEEGLFELLAVDLLPANIAPCIGCEELVEFDGEYVHRPGC